LHQSKPHPPERLSHQGSDAVVVDAELLELQRGAVVVVEVLVKGAIRSPQNKFRNPHEARANRP